jgi:hypothetical protein
LPRVRNKLPELDELLEEELPEDELEPPDEDKLHDIVGSK